MNLTQVFRDVPIGAKCTGTVLAYNLNGSQLVRQRMLAVEGSDYILVRRQPRAELKDMERDEQG